jgi:hypothetical protein
LLLVGFVLAAILPIFLGGCGNPTTPFGAAGGLGLDAGRQVGSGQNWQEGLVDTKSERWARYNLSRDIEDREFQDDFDVLFLLDRNSYLTQWHPSTGR